jgi:amino acid transporter
MIYILLAYGGWSDAATLSSEMLDERRGIMRALIIGMTLVTVLYLAANWAFLRALGHAGLIRSTAPAADVMLVAFGRTGQLLMVGVVAITAITVMNALLIAGARTTYAAARDTDALAPLLGRWHVERGTPPAAIVALSLVALLLVGFGAVTRHGVSTMVDYMSPVFWSFLAMSGLGVIVLRRRYPDVVRPFSVPFYPWLPLIFVGSCLYVLWSSVAYVKLGAMVGVAVLTAGALALAVLHRWSRR